ncbi:tartrate dehydrogenase [Kyrpidia tusciae]|uniref:D-malate dehydrogenase (decarboxylating) n=1 Tax=Kyrpidia tusciae (strain DSM 2912 / NBRC 15312 / T2) TaxID=562970 RepID=D5WWB3_KYRT2|nr:tartrate dehydrogenase [Kyrpidia tusciae]ADG07678.1 tartrate dehydrogenase [Kyrpidia tusciae DSM 2912]
MRTHRIAVIPGDGIGPEVVREGVKVLEAAAVRAGMFRLEFDWLPWNCSYYRRHGRMMPADGIEQLRTYDGIYLGAVGDPSVPDHVSVWQLILPIRKAFQQYVNLRPAKLLAGLESPLRHKEARDLDFVIVRENTEGEYSDIGGRLHPGTPVEMAVQTSVFTRYGIERVARYALSLARRRRGHVAVATKSNGLAHTMPYWDEVIRSCRVEFPDVDVSFYHVDALSTLFVLRPETLDVVLATNLFGDILSDLGAAVVGGLGVAPAGNINPEKRFPSMFEPVHGSAPDIAGKGIANPIAAIWSGAMMLEHLGHPEPAAEVVRAIEQVLAEGRVWTRDLGGTASTEEVGDAVVRALEHPRPVGARPR